MEERVLGRDELWRAYRSAGERNPWHSRVDFDWWLNAQCVEHWGREPLYIAFYRHTKLDIRAVFNPKNDDQCQPWIHLALCFRACVPTMNSMEIVLLAKESASEET